MLLYVLLWLMPLCLILLWMCFPVWLRACWVVFGWRGVAVGLPLMLGAYGVGFTAAFPLSWLRVLSFWMLILSVLGLLILALATGCRPWQAGAGPGRWLTLVVSTAASALLLWRVWPW